MNNDTKTRTALIAAAKDFLTVNPSIQTKSGLEENLPVLPANAIAWENRKFEFQGKGVWSSVFYRPNQPIARTIGPCGQDELSGFMQIDINVALDSGEEDLIAWERKARLFFHAGRFFTFENLAVIVTSTGMSAGRIVDTHYRKSITVAFRSHLHRTQLT